jgi:drug/metabolite transporter (DMT)-like permease
MPRSIPSERLLATAATAATLVMWASAFVGIRALAPSLAPGPLAFGRLVIAAAALGLVVLIRRPARPARGDVVRLAVCGAAWPGAYFVLLNASERHVDAATASILVKLAPVLVALAAGAMLREGFPARVLGGCAIALAGVVVVGAGGRGDLVGAALGVGAAVAYAAGVVLQKPVVGRVSPVAASAIGTAAGAVLCLPFAPALAERLPELDAGALTWLVYLGLFPTAIAFTTWAYALARTPAGRLAATTYLVPPLTAAFAWWLLGEAPTGRSLVGGVISLLGVVVACTTWRLRRRAAGPEAAVRRAA